MSWATRSWTVAVNVFLRLPVEAKMRRISFLPEWLAILLLLALTSARLLVHAQTAPSSDFRDAGKWSTTVPQPLLQLGDFSVQDMQQDRFDDDLWYLDGREKGFFVWNAATSALPQVILPPGVADFAPRGFDQDSVSGTIYYAVNSTDVWAMSRSDAPARLMKPFLSDSSFAINFLAAENDLVYLGSGDVASEGSLILSVFNVSQSILPPAPFFTITTAQTVCAPAPQAPLALSLNRESNELIWSCKGGLLIWQTKSESEFTARSPAYLPVPTPLCPTSTNVIHDSVQGSFFLDCGGKFVAVNATGGDALDLTASLSPDPSICAQGIMRADWDRRALILTCPFAGVGLIPMDALEQVAALTTTFGTCHPDGIISVTAIGERGTRRRVLVACGNLVSVIAGRSMVTIQNTPVCTATLALEELDASTTALGKDGLVYVTCRVQVGNLIQGDGLNGRLLAYDQSLCPIADAIRSTGGADSTVWITCRFPPSNSDTAIVIFDGVQVQTVLNAEQLSIQNTRSYVNLFLDSSGTAYLALEDPLPSLQYLYRVNAVSSPPTLDLLFPLQPTMFDGGIRGLDNLAGSLFFLTSGGSEVPTLRSMPSTGTDRNASVVLPRSVCEASALSADVVNEVLYVACACLEIIGCVGGMHQQSLLILDARDLTYRQLSVAGTLYSIAFNGPARVILAISIPLNSGSHSPLTTVLALDVERNASYSIATSEGSVARTILVDQRTGISYLSSSFAGPMFISHSYRCPVGMYFFAGSCVPCVIGTANNDSSSDNFPPCRPCAQGSIAPTQGSAHCKLCDRGTYSTDPGEFGCTLCAKNEFSNDIGRSTRCSFCPAGSESVSEGGTSCSNCTLGSSSVAGSPCTVCSVNSYTPSPGASACVSCNGRDQEGLDCGNGLAAVKADWWAYLEAAEEYGGQLVYRTTKCPLDHCPGAQLQGSAAVISNSSAGNTTSPSSLIAVTPVCLFPRRNSPDNWLCAECEDGYLPWGPSCDACTGWNRGMAALYILFCIAFVIFLLYTGSSSASMLAIFLFFIQTASLEVGELTHALTWLKFFNLGASSIPTCVAPWTPLQQTLFTLVTPLFLIGILSVLCLFHFTIKRFDIDLLLYSVSERDLAEFSLDPYIGCVVSIFLASYTAVSVAVVQMLDCRQVAPGVTLLFSMPSVSCDSAAYLAFLPVVIAWLSIYILGIPVGMLIFLWTKREVIMRETAQAKQDQLTDKAVTLSPLALRWGPIYRSYTAHAWYWTPLLLLRRFLFTITSVLLGTNPARFAVYGFLHLTSMIGHVYVHPFEDALMNRVETASYLCLLYLTMALTTETAPYSVGVQVLLTLLVAPFACGLFLWTAKNQFMRCRDRCLKKSGAVAGMESADRAAEPPASPSKPFHSSLTDSEMEVIQP
jgi:hypothetical protein